MTTRDIRDAIRAIRQKWDVPQDQRAAIAAAVDHAASSPDASDRLLRAAEDFRQACEEADWLAATPTP